MRILAVLAVACSGCFVLTSTTKTTVRVATEHGDEREGPIQELSLSGTAGDGQLLVTANAKRTCTRNELGVYETRIDKSLRMGGADDPRAKVFGFFLAPVTLPVSFLVSSVSMLADSGSERSVRVERSEHYACTHRATAVPVTLELASGAHVEATTDPGGQLGYTIPSTEPYEGTIELRSSVDAKAHGNVGYQRARPPLVAARAAMDACGAGAETLALDLDDGGLALKLWVSNDADRSRARCVEPRIAAYRFPHGGKKIVVPGAGPVPAIPDAVRIEPACTVVAADHDQLSHDERQRAREALARALEHEDELVTDAPCKRVFVLWHEHVGEHYTVHVRGPAGTRHTTVPSASDLPAAYAELARMLVGLDQELQAL